MGAVKGPALERLEARQRAVDSLLCVGLDSGLERLPERFRREPRPQLAWGRWIIDETHQQAAAYKPNLAFYEARGAAGWEELAETVAYLRTLDASIFIIADAKRADIGSTRTRATSRPSSTGSAATPSRSTRTSGRRRCGRSSSVATRPASCSAGRATRAPGELQDLPVDGVPLWEVVATRVSGTTGTSTATACSSWAPRTRRSCGGPASSARRCPSSCPAWVPRVATSRRSCGPASTGAGAVSSINASPCHHRRGRSPATAARRPARRHPPSGGAAAGGLDRERPGGAHPGRRRRRPRARPVLAHPARPACGRALRGTGQRRHRSARPLLPIAATDVAGHRPAWCRDERPDLVVVGPDEPLALGLVDALAAVGVRRLRSRPRPPRASNRARPGRRTCAEPPVCPCRRRTSSRRADAADALRRTRAATCSVVKADGLALGKGVIVCDTVG